MRSLPDLSVRKARALPSRRRLVVGALLALAALAGAVVGVLANGGGLSGWDSIVIAAAGVAFAVVIVDAALEFRDSRGTRELVVNLATTGADRAAIEQWTQHTHVRGILDVYSIIEGNRTRLSGFALRYGQFIDPVSPPVLTLVAEVRLPSRNRVSAFDLCFEPDSSDWRHRTADLYDKDSLADELFDTRDRNDALGEAVDPEVLVLTDGVWHRRSEFLTGSQRPDLVSCIRFCSSIPRRSPSLFNLVRGVGVSLSGGPSLTGAAASPSLREEFALLGRLSSHGRVVEVLHYSAWLRLGDAADLEDRFAEQGMWAQEVLDSARSHQ